MYHVQPHRNGITWSVINDHRGLVFVGTKQQVEDWLDFQDNKQKQRRPFSYIGYLFGCVANFLCAKGVQ